MAQPDPRDTGTCSTDSVLVKMLTCY